MRNPVKRRKYLNLDVNVPRKKPAGPKAKARAKKVLEEKLRWDGGGIDTQMRDDEYEKYRRPVMKERKH